MPDAADKNPRRLEGESALLEQLPADPKRALDLGTGHGRLIALLRTDRPEIEAIGLDVSEPMLDAARRRFSGETGIEIREHDLSDPLPELGRFDVVVSALALHRLEHERKRELCAEVFEILEPGGIFANLEHVASATERLHRAFLERIGKPPHPEGSADRLLDVETQLTWLREIGFDDVDCYWKWLEMALMIGFKRE